LHGAVRTDVDDVAIRVDHDVAIVAVLDLQYITGKRVRRHGLDKVEARALERNGLGRPIAGHEEVVQVVHLCAAHFVARRRVRNNIDHTALVTQCQINDTMGCEYIPLVQSL
jgi:hypothetical protein